MISSRLREIVLLKVHDDPAVNTRPPYASVETPVDSYGITAGVVVGRRLNPGPTGPAAEEWDEGKPSIVTPEHARHVIEIMEKGYQAAREGRAIQLRSTM